MSGSVKIEGRFNFKTDDGDSLFFNEITDDGIDRIIDLISGASSEHWSDIRLELEDGTTVSKRASTTRRDSGVLLSKATFLRTDLPEDIEKVQMVAGDTVVAEASSPLEGRRTIVVERTDKISKE